MHLRPEMVRPDKIEDVEDVTIGRVFSYAMPATTPNGVVGRPSEATRQDGEMMMAALIEDLEAWIDRAISESWPTLPRARAGTART
jgi:creatinine amidohydrolase